ncbi:MAG: hypothetical protein IJY33_05355 [Oscillospiraceae bacterium]|nr:hypothetical protein [Oscillospiraceae bacterium]
MPSRKTASFYMEKEQQKYMTPAAKNYLLCSWYRYMFKYIPFRTGLMASLMDIPENVQNIEQLSPDQALELGLQSIQINPENVIHFRAPYASRQNEGDNFNFTRDLHPLAQAHWEQVAADLHGEQIINELKAFKKRSGNK